MELKKQNFIQIINENRGAIRSLCKIYYGSNEDQKDAFQDVILQLWKSFDTFRGESEISTWIYRVSLNTILSKIKREKKSVRVEPIDVHHFHLSNAKADDHVELLFMIIQSLKDIDKAIVVLHLEGYQNKEIAEILNISPTNVSTRFNRVKSQLKMKFNKEYHASKQS
ncbi:MAG: sigma-70 family RNA polymerase sigma factor [Chitinophagales bacterium]|nr:sigma-70 family RNA polymerase sigma factor [Chitinophagales bacterium]